MVEIERIIKSAMKSGRVLFGSKQAIRAAKTGNAVSFIFADNVPPSTVGDVKRYAEQNEIPVFSYPGRSVDLGRLCGQPFSVSVVTVRTLSDSILLKRVKASMKPDET
jgi:large subunit ribosomal protein L30e